MGWNKLSTYKDLGFCKVDVDREQRTGYPEIIYGEGKSAEQINLIMAEIIAESRKVLVTRVEEEKAAVITSNHPLAVYDDTSRTIRVGDPVHHYKQEVLILCAGTSDLYVAEEAAITAEWMGCKVKKIYDVGVAGIDRLLSHREEMESSGVIIAVAGMEGALPSVVGGLTKRPVIAVPTSVGYGAHLQGLTPLLSMLTSCASGVSVVNIDNGFGAAYQASLILQLVAEANVT